MNKTIYCLGCGFRPKDRKEYIVFSEDCGCTPEEYVIREEGTYDPGTGTFLCTDCYIKAGMPLYKDIARPKNTKKEVM